MRIAFALFIIANLCLTAFSLNCAKSEQLLTEEDYLQIAVIYFDVLFSNDPYDRMQAVSHAVQFNDITEGNPIEYVPIQRYETANPGDYTILLFREGIDSDVIIGIRLLVFGKPGEGKLRKVNFKGKIWELPDIIHEFGTEIDTSRPKGQTDVPDETLDEDNS